MAPAGMLRMAVAEFNGEPVSAFLWLVLGDTMNCWLGAWSGEHRYRRPNEALDWSGSAGRLGKGCSVVRLPRRLRLHARVRWIPCDVSWAARAGSNPLLRRLYPRALHRMLDTPSISRLKQVVRTRGWPGSLKSIVYPVIVYLGSVLSPA